MLLNCRIDVATPFVDGPFTLHQAGPGWKPATSRLVNPGPAAPGVNGTSRHAAGRCSDHGSVAKFDLEPSPQRISLGKSRLYPLRPRSGIRLCNRADISGVDIRCVRPSEASRTDCPIAHRSIQATL